MNSVNKSISLGIIYFIGFGCHPIFKIKSPLLWDNTGLIYFIGSGYHPVLKIKSPLLWDNTGLHPHVKIRLILTGWTRPVKLFSVVCLTYHMLDVYMVLVT